MPKGDAINVVLSAAGYNFRRLVAGLEILFAAICCVIAEGIDKRTQPISI